MGSFAVTVAAALGLVAGGYARALAHGFGADPGDHRKEARAAFAAASRTVPVPRRPYLMEAVTAGAAAWVVALRLDSGWVLAAWLYAVVAGVALAAVDWRTWRLPDAITLPSYPILLVLLTPSGELSAALAGAAALGGGYGALWFARPTGLGLGDVKLAGLIGLVTGPLGPTAVISAGFGGLLLGAVYAVGLVVTGRATRTSEFPFGPFMLAGALVAPAVPG